MPKSDAKALRTEATNLGVKNWQAMSADELKSAVAKARKKRAAVVSTTKKVAKKGKKPTATGKVVKKDEKVTASSAVKAKPTASKSKAKKAPSSKAPAKTKASAVKTAGSKKPAPKSTKKMAPKKAPVKKATPAKSNDQVTPENPFRSGSGMFETTKLLLKGGKREVLASRLAKKVNLHPYRNPKAIDLKDYDKRITLTADTLKREYGFTLIKEGRGIRGTIKVVPPSAKKSTSPAKKTTAKKVVAKKAAPKSKAAPKKGQSKKK